MAIDILSIPAINNKSERVFLKTRRTISWKKAQIEAENLKKKIEYLKHWKRSGISDEMLEIVD
jgi:hypothetical protein